MNYLYNIGSFIYDKTKKSTYICRIMYDKFHENNDSPTTRLYEPVSYYNQTSMFLDDPVHIIDNIYLGSAYNACNYDLLKSLGITHIINITSDITNYYPDEFKYYRYNIEDNNSEDIPDILSTECKDKTSKIDKILSESKMVQTMKHTTQVIKMADKVFIHCFMGASRSVANILYYLITEKKMTLYKGLELIKSKRQWVNPNINFIKLLGFIEYRQTITH